MFTLKLTDSDEALQVEGIDLNVWDSNLYGSGPARGIVVTGYPMFKDENGLWDTDTDVILFSADTNFNPEEWDEDAWYGLSEDTAPGEVPNEVMTLVNNILKELSV